VEHADRGNEFAERAETGDRSFGNSSNGSPNDPIHRVADDFHWLKEQSRRIGV